MYGSMGPVQSVNYTLPSITLCHLAPVSYVRLILLCYFLPVFFQALMQKNRTTIFLIGYIVFMMRWGFPVSAKSKGGEHIGE